MRDHASIEVNAVCCIKRKSTRSRSVLVRCSMVSNILSTRRRAYARPSVELVARYTVEYQLPNLRRSPAVASKGSRE